MRTRAHSGLFVLVGIVQWSVSFGADGSWITLAPMTDPRQEVGTAASNGKVYANRIGSNPVLWAHSRYEVRIRRKATSRIRSLLFTTWPSCASTASFLFRATSPI